MIIPLAIITIFTTYLLYVRFKENKHRRLDSNHQETKNHRQIGDFSWQPLVDELSTFSL